MKNKLFAIGTVLATILIFSSCTSTTTTTTTQEVTVIKTNTTTVTTALPPIVSNITLPPVTVVTTSVVTQPPVTTRITTTATETVTQPPVTHTTTLPATTVTVTTTLPPTTAPPTPANSLSFAPSPTFVTVSQVATAQNSTFDFKWTNTSAAAFTGVTLKIVLSTNIPNGSITNTSNITLSTLGYTWALGVGAGANGVYTFTGTPPINFSANAVFDLITTLSITWNVAPPTGTYYINVTGGIA